MEERAQDLFADAGSSSWFEVDGVVGPMPTAPSHALIQNAERLLQSFRGGLRFFVPFHGADPRAHALASCRFLHQALQAVENGRLNLPRPISRPRRGSPTQALSRSK